MAENCCLEGFNPKINPNAVVIHWLGNPWSITSIRSHQTERIDWQNWSSGAFDVHNAHMCICRLIVQYVLFNCCRNMRESSIMDNDTAFRDPKYPLTFSCSRVSLRGSKWPRQSFLIQQIVFHTFILIWKQLCWKMDLDRHHIWTSVTSTVAFC